MRAMSLKISGNEREHSEEKHLERRHAESARLDEADHRVILHAGVHDQPPEISHPSLRDSKAGDFRGLTTLRKIYWENFSNFVPEKP